MANGRATVAETAARQLANATKDPRAMGGNHAALAHSFSALDPGRGWYLPLEPCQADARRDGRVGAEIVEASPPRDEDPDLPETFVDYEENPREYFLSAITTVLDVQTRVSDLYSRPFDQIQEQLRLLIEKVKETHEERADQQSRIRPARERRASR